MEEQQHEEVVEEEEEAVAVAVAVVDSNKTVVALHMSFHRLIQLLHLSKI